MNIRPLLASPLPGMCAETRTTRACDATSRVCIGSPSSVRTASLGLLIAGLLATGMLHAATPIDETRSLDANADVSLSNVKGRIAVSVWDRPEIHIGGSLGDGVKALEIEGSGGKVEVSVRYPDSSGWFGLGGGNNAAESELLVKVPAGVALSVDGVSADIEVRGVAGRTLRINSVSGDVQASSDADDIDIDNVSGDVSLDARSQIVSLESVSGDVSLTGDVSREISVKSVSGDVQVQSGTALRKVTAGVVSGDIELALSLSAGARLRAESLSGDLELVLPASTSARLKASSFTGTLRSDAGSVVKPEHGPGSKLEAVLGGGDGQIDVETFSGDLRIRLQ